MVSCSPSCPSSGGGMYISNRTVSRCSSYNIRKKIADKVLEKWSGYISFDRDILKAAVSPKYRRLSRARYNARRTYRRDLQYIKNNGYGKGKDTGGDRRPGVKAA